MQRLHARAQYQAVLAGRPVARTAHFALHRIALDASALPSANPLFDAADAWLGALIPKRWARRAVRRNLIRRQIHAMGDGGEAHASGAAVVRLRAAFPKRQFPSACSDALKHAVRDELRVLFGSQAS